MGFFQYIIIERFIEMTKNANFSKPINYKKYEDHLKKLKTALNEVGWEENYYLRAFFDNGKKLGSIYNDECKIDLISQSFAVLSGVAPKENVEKLIDAVEDNLVDKKLKIVNPLRIFHLSS